jgi:choloylglycine hydrolase
MLRKGSFSGTHEVISAMCLAIVLTISQAASSLACTGIRLVAKDGTVVYGRTMEWGAFDLNSRVAIIPRGHTFTGLTPEGDNGKTWVAKYGVVALDMLEHDWFADGMNEAGLAVGLFYHPGFAEYPAYDPDQASSTISPMDVVGYLLTQFATIDEAKAGLAEVRIANVLEDLVGIPDSAHWMVTEPSGSSIVIEYANGEVRFFENQLGVITNAPTYDWHMTNLRNYLNLSAVALPTLSIADMDFAPIGAGSGMIGLPGDNTPPSRFVRAVAWTQTARSTPTSSETVYEMLRILDNFNLPLGAAEGSGSAAEDLLKGMRSSTIWTSVWDLAEETLYFHTQHSRRLRKVSLDGVDFDGEGIRHIPLDRKKLQDTEDLTPGG